MVIETMKATITTVGLNEATGCEKYIFQNKKNADIAQMNTLFSHENPSQDK